MANIHSYSRPITSKFSNLPENETQNIYKNGRKERAMTAGVIGRRYNNNQEIP